MMNLKSIIVAFAVIICHGQLNAQNTFPADGNVGIGTINPTQKLEVVGNVLIHEGGSLMFRRGMSYPVGATLDVSGNGLYLHLSGLGLLPRVNNVQDLGAENFRFRNLWLGSNMFVGQSIYVNSPGNAGVIVDGNNLSRVGLVKYPGRPGGIWRVANQDFEIGRTNTNTLPGNPTQLTTDLYVSGTGNVGIGTRKPSEKLSVNGTIMAKKIKITLTAADWADYVFDSSYQLMPITALSDFIKHNKHLPEIPSAQEIEKNGVDVGLTQSLLLKKVEELTLYMIAQQEKIEAAKKNIADKNKALHAQISLLEEQLKKMTAEKE